jgi:hypothetical protein
MVRGDQIEMQNGDRYIGAVMSMTPDTIILKSDILGQIKVPRAKVSAITFGAANNSAQPTASTTNSAAVHRSGAAQPSDDAALSKLGANKELIDKIKKQFLSEAGPQANEKFDDLLTGLATGKLDINDLRAQAKSAADQLRKMTKDMGGDAGDTMQVYLQVLDNFLAESAPPANAPATNSAQGTITIQ